MAIEDTIVKVSDKITKGLMDGVIAFKADPTEKPFFVLDNENIKFVVYGRSKGSLERVTEPSVEVSKDRQTVTHSPEKFARATKNVLVFQAVFGKDEKGFYDLGELPAPQPEETDEKFAKKIDTALTKKLQKFGIIA